jgi:hypothetical protein
MKGGSRRVKTPDSSDEVAADLAFMETLRRMKARFQAEVLARAKLDDAAGAISLRQESFFQLAEFLFAFRMYGIDSSDKLERFADLHNRYLLDVREDRERMRRYGLTPERIENALFTGENLRKLLANFAQPNASIDQSDLARFLVTVMSTETCRKLVLAGEEAGFLERVRSPFGAMLVRSNGTIEDVYGIVLREARLDATGLKGNPAV